MSDSGELLSCQIQVGSRLLTESLVLLCQVNSIRDRCKRIVNLVRGVLFRVKGNRNQNRCSIQGEPSFPWKRPLCGRRLQSHSQIDAGLETNSLEASGVWASCAVFLMERQPIFAEDIRALSEQDIGVLSTKNLRVALCIWSHHLAELSRGRCEPFPQAQSV